MDDIKKIISRVRTKEERDRALEGLRIIRGAIFRKGGEHLLKDLEESGIPAEIGGLFVETLKERESADHQAQLEFLEKLRKILENLALLKLEISFEPRERTLEKIDAWVKREVGENTVLDLAIERSIRGGARISFRGRYGEYTLDNLIASVLSSKREEIMNKIT